MTNTTILISSSPFLDNGVSRVKEEARPDKPPKVVHHDRVRRLERKGTLNTHCWVHDAITAFQRRAAVATQTENQDGAAASNDAHDATLVVQCVSCSQPRIDAYGFIRVLKKQRRCHLFLLRTINSNTNSALDAVGDHDLYYC